jgi:hypothetical protein
MDNWWIKNDKKNDLKIFWVLKLSIFLKDDCSENLNRWNWLSSSYEYHTRKYLTKFLIEIDIWAIFLNGICTSVKQFDKIVRWSILDIHGWKSKNMNLFGTQISFLIRTDINLSIMDSIRKIV